MLMFKYNYTVEIFNAINYCVYFLINDQHVAMARSTNSVTTISLLWQYDHLRVYQVCVRPSQVTSARPA